MSFPILFPFILSFLIMHIKSDCSMMQEDECSAVPCEAKGDRRKPTFIHTDPKTTYCPDYLNTPSCCTQNQLEVINKNLKALEGIFGGKGGCDVCVTNLKRFWCHFTCHPNQSEFLELHDITRYNMSGKIYDLRDATFTVNEETNCKLFQSCKKTKFVSQVPSMGNSLGFTNFQGINSYTKIPMYIQANLSYEGGLKYEIDNCEMRFNENGEHRGFHNNTNCTCNSCAKLCNYDHNSSLSVLYGINGWLIFGFYVGVLVFTGLLFFFRMNNQKKHKHEEEDFIEDVSKGKEEEEKLQL